MITTTPRQPHNPHFSAFVDSGGDPGASGVEVSRRAD
jgi:hypothetical protein